MRLSILAVLLLAAASMAGQAAAPQQPAAALPPADISGLYSFVHEGEFVQLDVEDGRVGGVLSRYVDDDPEKAQFVDQYIEQGKLAGNQLSFRTKAAQGVSYEFTGVVERGTAKQPEEEGYWIIRGSLIEHRTAADGKSVDKSRELVLRSFPQDAPAEAPAVK
jgi:hypothetical protein